MFRKVLMAILLTMIVPVFLPAETLGGLFQRAKEQIKASSWLDALKTLDALDSESAKPGLETQRKQLEPALALYRGVTFASLGRTPEASEQFEAYLATNPNASLDPAIYPKKAVVAMEETRRSIAARGATGMPSLAVGYRSFHVDPSLAKEPPRPEWADGPVRFLLTSEEKKQWSGLKDSVAREDFIEVFWTSRDPTPGSAQNEMRKEFERRVAFADARFGQGETLGSMTDRGMVFVLLGPPTYAGSSPMRSGDDSTDAMGNSSGVRRSAEVELQVAKDKAHSTGIKMKNSQAEAIFDHDNLPNKTATDSGANAGREVWHYRHELLPPGIPYQQVDFDFITRVGYGDKTLQRDAPSLTTLEAARKPAAWTPAALENRASR